MNKLEIFEACEGIVNFNKVVKKWSIFFSGFSDE